MQVARLATCYGRFFQTDATAALDVVGSFQEGLNNIPGMLGSPVRPQGQINSLQSGITEGTKGLVYGIFDGVTGLVKEPYKGAMESGVDGFVDGAFRGREWSLLR